MLFVGTKRQAADTVEREALRCGMPFVNDRWLGGTLTNFRTIRDRLGRLEQLEKILNSEEINSYSKKMQSTLTREYRKIYHNLHGMRTMTRLPECMVVVDPRKEKNAIKEARKLGIATVALIDNPDLDLAEPKIFRLNRDVRFSKNKDPYKTNIGGFLPVARGGAPSPSRPAALYIQYGVGEEGELGRNFVAAGIYGLEPAALTRFRAAIADARGDEFEALVRPLLAAGWTIGAMDRLKKVPKDYPADHPRGDWLKLKGFVLAPPAPLVGAPDAGLLGRLTAVGRAVAPVVRWLTFATA